MNKKGFTVIELIVSFTLVTIISIILFQLIFSLKELYVSGDIKTTLLNKQGIMVKKIYDDLEDDSLTSITSCGVSCLTFTYPEGSKTLLVDVAANTLTYGDYTMKLSDGSYFDQISFEHEILDTSSNPINDDSRFNISIPIKSKFLPEEDFGIHIIKTYKNSILTINEYISIDDATIIANGIPLDLRADSTIIQNTRTIWANIFHQDQIGININSQDAYFKDYNEFIKTNTTHKKSSLKSLDTFKIPCIESNDPNNPDRQCNVSFSVINELRTVDLITESSVGKTEKEIERIKEDYQDGFFELLLEYPSISASNYNLWTQTSNFVKSSKLENAYTIDSVYQGEGCLWNGLKYVKNNNDFYVNGCLGDNNFMIGTKAINTHIGGPGGTNDTVDSVNLWINVDQYIAKYSLSKIS